MLHQFPKQSNHCNSIYIIDLELMVQREYYLLDAKLHIGSLLIHPIYILYSCLLDKRIIRKPLHVNYFYKMSFYPLARNSVELKLYLISLGEYYVFSPHQDRVANRLSFYLASGTTRVQLGTNTLKHTVDFGRY